MMEQRPTWRKSSYSAGANNQCIEVHDCCAGPVGVRDSKVIGGPELRVTRRSWAALIDYARAQ